MERYSIISFARVSEPVDEKWRPSQNMAGSPDSASQTPGRYLIKIIINLIFAK